MAITLTAFDHGALCHGASWTVADEALLAQQIARVALGQSYHVEKILAGVAVPPPPTGTSVIQGAVAMLTAGADPYHRDGWMFQVMSWIAAHVSSPRDLIRPPQMGLADKGFDGLQLELDAAGHSVTAAVIFEDKATERSRQTIRQEVWPAFAELESGTRDNQLAAAVVTLLQTRPEIDPVQAVSTAIWSNVRRYRVAITVGQAHATAAGRQRLFQGYETVTGGVAIRRRAETFVVDELRVWMNQIAAMAVAAINDIGAGRV